MATPQEIREAKAENQTRLIKKYPNRRLYDTKTSSYITLADVKNIRTASRYLDCFAVDAKAWEQCAGQINARGAARHSDGLCVKQRLPEGIDGVDVRLGRSRTHG